MEINPAPIHPPIYIPIICQTQRLIFFFFFIIIISLILLVAGSENNMKSCDSPHAPPPPPQKHLEELNELILKRVYNDFDVVLERGDIVYCGVFWMS